MRENRRLKKNRGFTAGTLQEDLKLASEEVRDDEHLRYSKNYCIAQNELYGSYL
jgi:hypothetical protein